LSYRRNLSHRSSASGQMETQDLRCFTSSQDQT